MKNQKRKPGAKQSPKIKFFALGGLGEVGKNMYIVEVNDKIIIIDSGILFPDSSYGVDYIIPDYSYLIENQERILGLFITHGHEDHIGGIPFLLKKVKIPKVYATGLAVSLIKNKLSEHRNISIDLIEYQSDSIFSFQDFEISFFDTTHSIPDSKGIAIKTSEGYIVHTGDFKFDFTPITTKADLYKIARLGHEGVLALLSDSTNVGVGNFSASEKKIGESIKSLMSTIKGRVIISTFASNIYRVKQIVEASHLMGRKVIVFGRSMEKNITVAQKMNYFDVPNETFINAKQFPHLPPEKITILSTGSQGEPLAALSRIADGTHRQIQLLPGDTVVFSSSPIPGNQAGINRTINKLYRAGAEVIVNSPLTDTHTSGHASEQELKLMLSLVQPKYFVPIHGEYTMLRKHKDIAIETGVKPENCFILDNGDVIEYVDNQFQRAGKVVSGNVYVDATILDLDESIIKERKLLSDDGMFSTIFTINASYQQVSAPTIVSRGFIYMKNSEELANEIAEKAGILFDEYIAKNKKINQGHLQHHITQQLGMYIFEKTQRRPVVIPIIMNI